MPKIKNMFPYAGGKTCIIKELDVIFGGEVYDTFYDLFGGSGTVTISGNICCDNKVINDLETNIAILYYAFSDLYTMLMVAKKLKQTPLSQETFNAARAVWKEYDDNAEKQSLEELKQDCERFVSLAAAAYMLHLCYYCGLIDYDNVTITKEMIFKYERYIALERLEAYYYALRGVTVKNEDALTIINNLPQEPDDGNVSMIYLDVPYLPSNQTYVETSDTYSCAMSKEDHQALFEAVNKLSRKNYLVAISNYSNDLYDDLARKYGWHKIFLKERAVSSGISKKQKERNRENEYIYCNFEIFYGYGTVLMEF